MIPFDIHYRKTSKHKAIAGDDLAAERLVAATELAKDVALSAFALRDREVNDSATSERFRETLRACSTWRPGA